MKDYLVEANGYVWKLSKSSYVRLLKVIAAGQEYNLDDFGTAMNGYIRMRANHMDADGAAGMLKAMKL